MTVIDNRLLVDESAFIEYMGKELRDFQERMGVSWRKTSIATILVVVISHYT